MLASGQYMSINTVEPGNFNHSIDLTEEHGEFHETWKNYMIHHLHRISFCIFQIHYKGHSTHFDMSLRAASKGP